MSDLLPCPVLVMLARISWTILILRAHVTLMSFIEFLVHLFALIYFLLVTDSVLLILDYTDDLMIMLVITAT